MCACWTWRKDTSHEKTSVEHDNIMAATLQIHEWNGGLPVAATNQDTTCSGIAEVISNSEYVSPSSPYGGGGIPTDDDGNAEELSSASDNPHISKALEEPTLAHTRDPEPATGLSRNNSRRRVFAGLVNQGFTCYLNNTIQAMFMTPELRDIVWSWDPRSLPADSVPAALQNVFTFLRMSDGTVETHELTKALEYFFRDVLRQSDVTEFTSKLFDILEESLKYINIKKDFRQLYQGVLIDYVECLNCHTRREQEDVFQDIALALRGSVEEALRAYVLPEKLEGTNMYSCEKCGIKTNALKGLIFKKNPIILSITLKRFGLSANKLNDRVSFPLYLDMSTYMNTGDLIQDPEKDEEASSNHVESAKTPVPEDDMDFYPPLETVNSSLQQESTTIESESLSKPSEVSNCCNMDTEKCCLDEKHDYYELYSVQVHSGDMRAGHYYSYNKSLESKKWFKFNDATVYEVTEDTIEEAYGNPHKQSNAYSLVYHKIDNKNCNTLNLVESCTVPPNVVESITTRTRRTKLTVYFANTTFDKINESSVTWRQTVLRDRLTLAQLMENIAQIIGDNATIASELFRLVKIQKNLMVIRSFDEEDEVLNDPFSDIDTWLQMRSPAAPFPEYAISPITVFLLDHESFDIVNLKKLKVAEVECLDDLKSAIAELFGISQDNIQIGADSVNEDETVVINTDELVAQYLSPHYQSRLYVVNKAFDDDKMLPFREGITRNAKMGQYFIVLPQANKDEVYETEGFPIHMIAKDRHFKCFDPNLLNKEAEQRRVECCVDTAGDSTWLIGILERVLKLDRKCEKVYLYSKPILGNDETRVRTYTSLEEVLGDSSKAYPELEFIVRVKRNNDVTTLNAYLFDMASSDEHIGRKVSMSVPRNIKISTLKKYIIEKMNSEHGIQLVHDRSRLRQLESDLITVSTVYSDTKELHTFIKDAEGWSLCIQNVEEGKLYKDHLNFHFVFLQEYIAKTDTYGTNIREILVDIENPKEAIEKICNILGKPDDTVDVHVSMQLFPAKIRTFKKETLESWKVLKDCSSLLKTEIFADGQTIFYRY